MTVGNLAEALQLKVVACPQPDRQINGCYIGDLLSWVMGRADADQVWITIMSNLNIVAVASLADVACVLLAEGVDLEDSVRKTAEEKGINVLSSALDAYSLAVKLNSLLS